MSIIISALKLRLGAFGWAEAVRRDKQDFTLPAEEVGVGKDLGPELRP